MDSGRGWDVEPIRCIVRENASEALREAEKYVPCTYFSDANHGGRRNYAAAGTLHQPAEGPIYDRWLRGREVLQPEPTTAAEGAKAKKTKSGQPRAHRTTRSGKVYAPPEHVAREGDDTGDSGSLMLWTGVGLDQNKHHGRITLTDMGEGMVKAVKDPEDRSGLINLNRSRTIFNYVVGGAGLAHSVNVGGASDWRELGLRVCLYDDIRERRFTQPTGSDFSVARKQEPLLEMVPTLGSTTWGYEAMCVNWRYVDHYLQERGTMPVGPNREAQWDLSSEEVTVIGISDNVSSAGSGPDIWILSHLNYPLVYGLETFDVFEQGRDGIHPTYVPFVRTSSLVDVHSHSRKLVFVVMTDSSSVVDIGGVPFTVPILDRLGGLAPGAGPIITNFDGGVSTILRRCLTNNECLREAFEGYAGAYFVGGLDWMEIDNLSYLLKVRWNPKAGVEVREDTSGSYRRHYKFISKTAATAMGITTPEIVLEKYGSADAVTTLDQVPLPRLQARSNPHLRIGRWDSMAELGIVSVFAVYNAFDAENKNSASLRIEAGGQDSLMRCGYWRRCVEVWKRQNGLRDEIVTPSSYGAMGNYWTSFVEARGECGGTLASISGLMCRSKYATWSWKCNEIRTIRATSTGTRTPSLWWIKPLNNSWERFSIGGGDNHNSSSYALDTNRAHWSYNWWVPQDKGGDDYQLESVLNRLNLERNITGVDYIGLPSQQRSLGYGYCLEGFMSTAVAREAGWTDQFDAQEVSLREKRWGWGLNVVIRDWHLETLKKVVLNAAAAATLSAEYFMERTFLMRGPDSPPPSGTNRDYLYRLPTTDMEQILGNMQRGVRLAEGGRPAVTPRDGSIVSQNTSNIRGGRKAGDNASGKENIPPTDRANTTPGIREIRKDPSRGQETEKVDGRPSGTDVPLVKRSTREGEASVTRVMLTGGDQPKLGTTEERVLVNPDHRRREDTT